MASLLQNPKTGEIKYLEHWIDQYVIGSEGGSAWFWRKDGVMVGFTGRTRQEAVTKLLYHIFENELEGYSNG